MEGQPIHKPVLLREVIELLGIRPGMKILDATVGLGGHSRGMLEAAGGEGQVLGLDRDREALSEAGRWLAPYGDRVRLVRTRSSRFPAVLAEAGWEKVDAALLDAGMSSLQLDDPERGFGFLHDGPLDMRMGAEDGGETAEGLVNLASYARLCEIIREYGEDPQAGRIARAIVSVREKEAITTTARLAEVVWQAYPAKWRATARQHPATRTFQALRMAVNEELAELEAFLKAIPDHLAPGGRVAVISFHSLEDRLVKRAFRAEATDCICPREQVVCVCGHRARLRILTKKPVMAGEEEVRDNSRARSAKLRVAERLPDAGADVAG
ncbi:16S rRNA (cytosine(1402)-N(4))-methyltransferase RsmH [Solidesulfovibrio magneticus]|uniref:Ribosomal RNA small subunit methyltransferase H n=1 Tax=Solidesulfovibrio magneticus (strain ATCC 700980 / DSM 13731 / RS-1) TaxID=573370 RepID=RSMH_SOLM1|nr:16S rRNA (cytosine(1402)-N(4))-methyltransferase RsmH [Solidesulfovibrio magneticus]C4XK86.1 RecName: Full=Ribosomal RNA small subunit methyltransferase H; AltName: Full=16S rRNA m(4)C1402 methyltransferase; AltName: Full=rRNA (cytosine-N(4)-)-methyltransferase RsmH [Solidesulfovibrio magneticus RS-1]BAH76826.1 S-adenosyl-methyltransferase MraW [Solidesulfovibrio magneticus RS-1]